MANFLTRIELHDAESQDYDELHKAMERVGFLRKVKSDDGNWYALPTAEYWYENPRGLLVNARDVYEAAYKCALTTGKKFDIITSRLDGSIYNLRKIS